MWSGESSLVSVASETSCDINFQGELATMSVSALDFTPRADPSDEALITGELTISSDGSECALSLAGQLTLDGGPAPLEIESAFMAEDFLESVAGDDEGNV